MSAKVDGIPLCDCQDTERNYRIMSSSAASRGANQAVVTVLLRNGKVRRFAVDLVLARGQWLIADIHAPDTPSFLAQLRREVPAEEKAFHDEKR